VLAAGLFALKSPRWGGAALLLAGIYIALAAWRFVPPKTPDPAAAGARLSILHFNVAFRHEEPQRVVDYILRHADRFDVVVLIEAPQTWTRELKRLEHVYPHAITALEDTRRSV